MIKCFVLPLFFGEYKPRKLEYCNKIMSSQLVRFNVFPFECGMNLKQMFQMLQQRNCFQDLFLLFEVEKQNLA